LLRGHRTQGAYTYLTDETNQPEPPSEDSVPAAAEEMQAAEAPAEMTAATPQADDPADAIVEGPAPEAAPEPEPMVAEAEAAPETDVAAEPEAAPETEPMVAQVEAAPEADVAAEPEAAPELDVAAEPGAALEPEAMVAEAEAEEDSEPMTMAQLLDDPSNEVKSLKHGDVVEGTVVRIDPDEILVDFGGKSEGVVSNRELMSRRGPRDGDEARQELKVGDEVLVYVLQPESPEGHAVLSLRRAGLERKWRAMQERFDAGEIVEARVIDHNKGGLIVDLGVRGFVPISQIVDFPRRPRDEQPRDAAQEIAEKLQPFVGRTLRLKILEVNRKANRLILSEKVALYEERREKRDELFSSLQVGQRVQGTVRSIAPFGVFIDLGGIDGLVHKSELSWNKVNNPETAYAIGDEVEAEVIDINHERGRISLSIRRLQPDPWQESVAKYKIGDVISGTVTKLVNFGAFVRVEEGLEGLIHISELSNQRVAHPGDVVKESDTLNLKIISLDSERHRLGLSLKQAEERTSAEPAPAPAAATIGASPSAPARFDERPARRERGGRDRRDRDYRPEDAISEPDEGIDNTMAAAFAESGLLDQLRAAKPKKASKATPEPEAADEPEAIAAESEAEEAVAEAAPDEPAAEPAAVEPEAEEPVAEVAADEPGADEPEADEPEAEEPVAETAVEAMTEAVALEAEAAEPASEAAEPAAEAAEPVAEVAAEEPAVEAPVAVAIGEEPEAVAAEAEPEAS
jgi:small subunit ribosomal protein S1